MDTLTVFEPPTQTAPIGLGANVICTGVPWQTPFLSLSSTVHGLPSSHGQSTTAMLVPAQVLPLIFARMVEVPTATAVTVSVGADPLTAATGGSDESNDTKVCAEGGVIVTLRVTESPMHIWPGGFCVKLIWTGVPLHTPPTQRSSTVQGFPSSQVSVATVTFPLEQTVLPILARILVLLPPALAIAVTVRRGGPPETVTMVGSSDSKVTGAVAGVTFTGTRAAPPAQTPFARLGPKLTPTGVPTQAPLMHWSSTVQSFPSSQGVGATVTLVLEHTVPLILARMVVVPGLTPVRVRIGAPPDTVAMDGLAESKET